MIPVKSKRSLAKVTNSLEVQLQEANTKIPLSFSNFSMLLKYLFLPSTAEIFGHSLYTWINMSLMGWI